MKYKRISIADATLNDEYYSIVTNIFHGQAARVIQRNWRGWKNKIYDGKHDETLLDNTHSLRFLKEPYGNKAREHANRINKNAWINLDFQDPEFVRNIYKALRLNLIKNKNLMATALMLYETSNEFQNPIKQFQFDKNGPYHFEKILYATQENIINFKKQLQTLPANENCYFAINFSKKREILFLYSALADGYLSGQKEFHTIMKKFIQKLSLTDCEKLLYMNFVDDLNSENKISAKESLSKLVEEYAVQFDEELSIKKVDEVIAMSKKQIHHQKDYDSASFLTATLRPRSQLPGVEVSADYNESDPDSPLLCMIIPSMSSLIVLQETMYPKEDISYPFFTTGKFTTHFIRVLDEQPEQYKQMYPSRPVELSHPDVLANQEPHGFQVYNSLLTRHDLVHCWQSSQFAHKPLMRYIRKLLAKEKGYAMSKTIWRLTDLDFNESSLNLKIVMNQNISEEEKFVWRVQTAHTIIDAAGDDFWKKLDEHDNNLLLIIDMILNNTVWQKLLGFSTKDAFKLDAPNVYKGMHIGGADANFFIYKDLGRFQSIMNNMEIIIGKDKEDEKSIPYYILRYRLRNHLKGSELCNELNDLGIDKFLRWTRNGGLRLISANKEIESLNCDELYQTLLQEITVYKCCTTSI